MKNSPNNYIDTVKRMYLQAKQVLEITSNGDHKHSNTLRSHVSIDLAIRSRELVNDLEDHGVHLLFTQN